MQIELSTERSKNIKINGVSTDCYWALINDTSDHKVKIQYVICGQKEIFEADFNASENEIPNDCPSRFFKHSQHSIDKEWRSNVQEFWNELHTNTL